VRRDQAGAPPSIAGAERRAIDDCWNRIGIRGDASCPELERQVHCRNCPVFAAAARELLDAEIPLEYQRDWTNHFEQPRPTRHLNTRSALIFRIGPEWLALPTALLEEVVSRRPLHSVPHRRAGAVQGLVNVRGEILICVALDRTLGLEPSRNEGRPLRAGQRSVAEPRLLVVRHESHRLVFPVDEVYGPHRFHPDELREVPATVAKAAATYTRAILPWRERSVGLLDEQLLFYTLTRGLG
jgi:chemotaxis-related protein WspD